MITPHFLGDLVLRDLGRGQFALQEPLGFLSAKLERVLIAPAGFVTDLASIPPYVPGWLVPKVGDWDYPATIHDAAYRMALRDPQGNVLVVTKAQADNLFREGMEARGVGKVRRTAMYWAVRLFGRGTFSTGGVRA
jgi:hypothetical protein